MKAEYQGKLDEALKEILKVQEILDKFKGLNPDSEEFQNLAVELADFVIAHEEQMKNVQNFFKKKEVMDIAEKLRDVTGIDATGGIKKIREFEPKLGTYMLRYLSMMMMISSIFLIISDTDEHLAEKRHYNLIAGNDKRQNYAKQQADADLEYKRNLPVD